MFRKIIYSMIISVLVFSYCSFAAGFMFLARIDNGGEKKYKAIKLNQEIYNNSKENLADLMLYGDDNEAIPYFINSFSEKNNRISFSYPMKLTNSFTVTEIEKDDSTGIDVKYKHSFMDYAVSELQNSDIFATSIKITTSDTDFAKKVELYGSYDGNKF